ncbi:MAG: hypothetical protein ACO3JJ_07095 [Opitutaceae bacterium]
MVSQAFIAVGLGFVLMGGGLYALTLTKAKASPAEPTKAQLREQAVRAVETRKMRIAAAVSAGLGLALVLFFLF